MRERADLPVANPIVGGTGEKGEVAMATTKVSLARDPRKKHPWIVRWFGEFDPATNKKRRYSKAFRLKRHAERLQAEKQAEFDKGGQRDRPADITLGEFCEKYMARRKHEWAAKTRDHVDDVCSRLIGHFGTNRILASVNADDANAFWSGAKKLDENQNDRELSKASRNCLLRYLKTMFRYAVEWDHHASNPFVGIKAIKEGKRTRRKWHYIQPEEYRALLDVAPNLRWKVFYALAYTSGGRFGELFNLTKGNVDFNRKVLIIRSRDGSDESPPFHVKDHEDREVPLPAHTLKLVADWLRVRPKGSPFLLLTPERYELVRHRWHQCRKSGKPWLNDYMVNNVLRDIRSHTRRAGICLDGALTVHAFRKSCGQNWADHLPLNVVREFMGHASISTTAEFYSTVSKDHADQARWLMEALTTGTVTTNDAEVTPGAENASNRRAS